jgi:hypothetical protein
LSCDYRQFWRQGRVPAMMLACTLWSNLNPASQKQIWQFIQYHIMILNKPCQQYFIYSKIVHKLGIMTVMKPQIFSNDYVIYNEEKPCKNHSYDLMV